MKARVTMDSGAAGHDMIEGMFPRVKHESKTPRKKFEAVTDEQIRHLGEWTHEEINDA